MNLFIHFILLFIFSVTSGLPSTNRRHKRTIGGDRAAVGQFPFVVSIGLYHQYICGGSIIGEKTVVTAAQCVFGHSVDELTVLAGTNLLYTGGIFYNVTGITIHPDYTNHTFYFNDIAIVTINGTFEFNDLVNKISILPSTGLSVWSSKYLEKYQLLTLIGWGNTRHGEYSNELRYTKVLFITDKDCDRMQIGYYPRGAGQFCASSFNEVSACEGDLGSPLINQNGYLVGIVSYTSYNSLASCSSGRPYIYTAVQYYNNWISVANITMYFETLKEIKS